ncbi:methyltransferase-like protein 25B [Calliphora vicina]|uniref:methyltransferase-like protein 25B n=1 Tax=Calliphora vicina TaxID=7373 RepID=UPI00325A466F
MEYQFLSSSDLKSKINNCLNIIRKYDWLINSYVSDFYVDDHWSKLPTLWRDCFQDLPPDHLSYLLDTSNADVQDVCRVWLLSLLALKKAFKELCVKRQQNCEHVLPRSSLLDHPKLKHIFIKGVKPKKRHELEYMAALCKKICTENPVDFVIDFGAGLGHLARVLGYAYNIKVCGLEMQTKLNGNAYDMDRNMEKLIEKYLPATENVQYQSPTHVDLCLTAQMTREQFLAIIEKALGLTNEDYTFGIIGLHPCGDLGAILMRMFLQCKQAKFLNFVGCCYQKLSTIEGRLGAEKKPTQQFYGYPLSEYLKTSSCDVRLSYEAREISCHATELYNERLSQKDYDYLKVHSFRAAAERIIVKHYPCLKHSGLKNVKHIPDMKFEDYFYRAVKGLPVEHLTENDLNTSVTCKDLLNWKNILIFYTLRLFFAPLIESVVLYDRLLYLLENDCVVQINPIFDPRLSPRNHITTAVKKS